jgi:adenylate cyclase
MMAAGAAAEWAKEVWRRTRQVGALRLTGTLIVLALALLTARYSWGLPFAADAERGLYDIRFDWAAQRRPVDQDPRIVMVVYNDQTLETLGKRSPLDRRMLASALRTLDAMRPKAIGIDILIDQAQPEDPLLIAAMKGLKTPTFLAFASSDRAYGNEEQIEYWQEQFLRQFLAAVRSGPVRPASIRIEPDLDDSVMRSWPVQSPKLPPLLANAMAPGHDAFRSYAGSIDYALPKWADRPVFTKLPIDLFAIDYGGPPPPELARQIAGRYVLIGGDIKDADDFLTPMSRMTGKATKGVVVHAHLLAQLLDGRLLPRISRPALWLLALLAVVAGCLSSLLEMRSWKLPAALAVQFISFAGLPFLLQARHIDTQGLPALGWAAGWVLAFAAVGTAARAVGSEERRFAQSALGKYLPPDVAALILKEPERLSLRGEKRRIFALFSDLEGFTKLSHAVTPEQLSDLLNHYLDVMSETVLRHGGTIDKFVGDAVVAFWGAPIARDDDGERAVRAAIAMYEAGEAFRRSAGRDVPPIGCTRVGLHRGEAVVGNFGGKGRIQYTALGDGMNTAARLESANKLLHSTILVSREAKEQSGLDLFRPLGRVVLSGRATPVELWEPVPDMDPARRHRLTDLWLRFDGGDMTALAELDALAAAGEDAALRDLVYRLGKAGPGGAFVLASK